MVKILSWRAEINPPPLILAYCPFTFDVQRSVFGVRRFIVVFLLLLESARQSPNHTCKKGNFRCVPVFSLAGMNCIKKTVMLVAIATIGVIGCAGPKIPPGMGPQWVDVRQVLDVYSKLTDKTVEIAQEPGNNFTPIRLEHRKPLTRAQARRLIERSLSDQAGIIVLRRYDNRVIFGVPTSADLATAKPTTIETDLAVFKDVDPITNLVTLLHSAVGKTTDQPSLTFFAAKDEHLSSDQVLNLAFEDRALLSLHEVNDWKVVEEKQVHNLTYPEPTTAVVVRTNDGEYVVLLDQYSEPAWQVTFYKIPP